MHLRRAAQAALKNKPHVHSKKTGPGKESNFDSLGGGWGLYKRHAGKSSEHKAQPTRQNAGPQSERTVGASAITDNR